MPEERHLRPSLALVVACLALLISLGGVGYAAITLPANSVTTKQVKDRSLLKRDFRRGQLPRGRQGPRGQQGPQGLQGPQGVPGPPGANASTHVVIRLGQVASISGQYLVSGAFCHPGEVATGGGYYFSGLDQPDDVVELNRPDPTGAAPTDGSIPTLWAVQIFDVNGDDGVNTHVTAYVICASP